MMPRTLIFTVISAGWIAVAYFDPAPWLSMTGKEAMIRMQAAALALLLQWLWAKE